MAHNKKRADKMRSLESKELADIIESGSLRHAAARRVLHERGQDNMASAVDAKFLHSIPADQR